MKKKGIISIFLIFIIQTLIAQNSDNQLAFEYYQSKEYEKALVLFDKLYKKTKAKVYFNYEIKCLVALEHYKEAESLLKKRIKKDKKELSYLVDLGYVYERQNKKEKAINQYDAALAKLSPQRHQIT